MESHHLLQITLGVGRGESSDTLPASDANGEPGAQHLQLLWYGIYYWMKCSRCVSLFRVCCSSNSWTIADCAHLWEQKHTLVCIANK